MNADDFREFLEWACKQAKCYPTEAKALELAAIDGYANVAIAEEMKIALYSAQAYTYRALQKLAVQEWGEWEVSQFEGLVSAIRRGSDVEVEARETLDAIRNSQDPTPRPCEYDDNGRPVARRDPQVSIGQMILIILGTRSFPAKFLAATGQTVRQ